MNTASNPKQFIRIVLLFLLLTGGRAFSQNIRQPWLAKDPFYDRVFIKNEGQYQPDHGKIFAGFQNDDFNAFIRDDGFNIKEFILNPESEEEERESEKGTDKRFEHPIEEVNIYADFLNTNANKYVMFGKYESQTFGFKDDHSSELRTINNVPACKVMYIHDLYPGILLTYSFENDRYGMEYSFQVEPGSDPSQIKIEFRNTDKLFIDAKGDLHIRSDKGEIVQEAPYAFIDNKNDSEVKIAYKLEGNVLSFDIGPYDHSKVLLIDPFLINPNFTNQNKALDVTCDALGFVYAFGGQNPWKLKKFNGSNGALIWTNTTTYASWYGDLATDPSGNSYITEGCCGGGMQKISTNNVVLWNQNYGVQEFWCLTFNCDFTNLYLAQGYASSPFVYNSISNVNLNTGAVTGGTAVIGSEPRSLGWGPSGNMYLLGCSSGNAPNQVVGITPAFTNIFAVASNYALAYNGPAYANGSNPTSGQNGIAAGYNFFCTSNGATLYKRNLLTGAQLGTLNIPGGVAEGNSGILIDACDNIYVGSSNGNIYKYDMNLNLLATAAAGGPVYCLYPGQNGEVIGCGNGFVGAFALNYQRNPFTFTTASTPASCACTGTASVTVTFTCNNNLPLLYSWNTGATTSSISALCPGNYSCVIKTNGCLSDTAYVTVTGSSSGGFPVTSVFTNPSCNNSTNGQATVTPNGGNGPYTYSWTTNPVQTSSTATGLTGGSYTVFVTDATGCTASDTIVVTTPPILTVNTNVVQPSCGSNNGSITANGAGGTGVLTYSWSTTATTQAINNLPSGNYTVYVTDANGCTVTATVNLNPANGPTALASINQDVSCFGGNNGSANAIANGGNGPYTFVWSNAQTGQNATGLNAGTYTVTVTDASGCTSIDTVLITQPTQITLNIAGFPATCFGSSNGSCVVIPGGGVGPYTYNWMPGNGTQALYNNIPAGNYTVTVTDANGCTDTASAAVTQPTQLVLASNTQPSTCNLPNGSATVNANGGTGPYTYSWTSNPVQTTSNATGLLPGNYTVFVTDVNGCTDTSIVAVQSTNAPASQVTAQTNVTCHAGTDGSATITVNGGIGPYTYSWTSNPAQTTTNATGLTAGTYTFYVTDANGCIDTSIVIITEPTQLVPAINPGNAQICIGQNINLQSATVGGTPVYAYVWSSGQTTSGASVSPTSTTSYTLTVTDANGCTATATCTVTVNPLPVVNLVADDTSGCGSLCVNFNTTTVGSSYSWNFGDGGTSISQNPQHCYVTPGNYTVSLTVTSAAGCSATFIQNNYIDIFPEPIAAFTANPTSVTQIDPTIYFTDQSTGATTWTWTFGDVLNGTSNQQNPTYTYTDTGYHQVMLIVTNQFGCVDTAIMSVYVAEAFTFYVPNAFTPTKDDLNSFFMPKGVGIDEDNYDFLIFDRWGNLIWETKKWGVGWDGRANGGKDIAQIDVYVWVAYVRVRSSHEDKTYIGHVSLIK